MTVLAAIAGYSADLEGYVNPYRRPVNAEAKNNQPQDKHLGDFSTISPADVPVKYQADDPRKPSRNACN